IAAPKRRGRPPGSKTKPKEPTASAAPKQATQPKSAVSKQVPSSKPAQSKPPALSKSSDQKTAQPEKSDEEKLVDIRRLDWVKDPKQVEEKLKSNDRLEREVALSWTLNEALRKKLEAGQIKLKTGEEDVDEPE